MRKLILAAGIAALLGSASALAGASGSVRVDGASGSVNVDFGGGSASQGGGGHSNGHADIPPGHRPPPGKCRVWYKGREPGQQPPPGNCKKLKHEVPAGAILIRG